MLSVSFRLAESIEWAEAGHEIAWFERWLNVQRAQLQPTTNAIFPAPSELSIRSSKIQSTISGPDFTLTFDRTRGDLTSWFIRGSNLLFSNDPSPLRLSFWRPPTDNDARSTTPQWRRWGLDVLTTQLRSFEITRIGPSEIRVEVTTFLAPPILAWGFAVRTIYRVLSSGAVTVTYDVLLTDTAPATVPRIGIDIHLSDCITKARWYGRGPGESYPDKKLAQRVGIYESSIEDLHTAYDVPQENGNHCSTQWVEVLTPAGFGVRAIMDGGEAFDFGASRYSARELEQADHQGELELLERTGKGVYWRVDHRVAGVGTAACGPGVKEVDQVACGGWEFEFEFRPLWGRQ